MLVGDPIYGSAFLVFTRKQEAAGNPVRFRDGPAAVCEDEHRNRSLCCINFLRNSMGRHGK